MAKSKVRRIIRKRHLARPEPFDEQLWPIQLTLVVLGGFLLGLVLAYLRFNDLRWWANARTWLVAVPVLIVILMIVARFVDRQVMRRAVQLSLALCLLIHVILGVVFYESKIFSRIMPNNREVADVTHRPRVTIPEYHEFQLNPQQRSQQDFLRPVETATPEPETEQQLQQEPIEQPEPLERVQPQLQPIPEPETTVRPAEIEQRRPSETVPRVAEQSSQLSRQTMQTPSTAAQAAAAPAAPQESSDSPPTPRPAAPAVERQAIDAPAPRLPMNREPATTNEQTQRQLARRETQSSPTPQTTAAPTMPRRLAEPQVIPRTTTDSTPQVAAAQQTDAQEPQPMNVAVTRQTSTPTPVERAVSEPVEAPSQTTANVQRRQVESVVAPTVAQAPAPNPQRRTATPVRPEVAAVAENPASSSTPQPSPSRPTVIPQTSPIARQTAVQVESLAPPVLPPSPEVSPQAAPTTLARRATTQTPAAVTSEAPPAVQRQATQQIAATETQAQATATPGAATTTTEVATRPSSVAVARQATSAPQIARSSAEPTSAATASESSPTGANLATRRLRAEAAPTVAQAPTSAPGQRRAVQAAPTATEIAATEAPSAAPEASAVAAQIRPSSSSVARQATSSPSVSQNSLAIDVPSASPTMQAAQPSRTRAEAAAAPSLNPSATAAASPARSATPALAAVSPTPVESPALAEATPSTGSPAAQPAQMALSRGETGVAGIGASVNLDRAGPTDSGASTVASASAVRATARSTTTGPELSPSAPALVARANAGDATPSATLQSADVPLPNTLGAERPSELNASSSAALARADSQAEAASVSAAAGTVEVDMGPTRVVATSGVSRAEGGGQPDLNSQQQSRLAARSATSGAPQVALATTNTADIAAAPMATGGGEPPRPNPQLDALAAVASNAGGGEPISGGPSSAVETGPIVEASGAESVAPLQTARAASLEAPPGAGQAGGGQNDPDASNDPPQLARAVLSGDPGSGPQSAELLASAPSSPGEPGAAEDEEEEERQRLAALAAAAGSAGPVDAGGAAGRGGPGGAAQAGPPSEPSDAAIAGAPKLARAEAVAAAPGAPEAGGGSLARTQPSAGPDLAATLQADAPTVAGLPASAGQPNVEALAASSGDVPAPLAGGLLASAEVGPVGALEGPEMSDAAATGQPGPQVGRRAASSATADGPLLADASNSGAPGRRNAALALAGGLAADAAPAIPTGAPSGGGSTSEEAGTSGDLDNMAEMDMSQLAFAAASGAQPVSVPAPEGPGGVGETLTTSVGLTNRRGHEDSQVVHFRDARFMRREVGGTPAVNLTAIAPAEAFAQRLQPKEEGDSAGGGGPPPLTEETIELGLAFLAKHQMPDGSWSFSNFGRGQRGYENESAALESDTAATGLALLAFQGGGYTHQHGKYKDTVRKALEFLMRNQRADGDLYVRTGGPSDAAMWLYSHGVASLAMCEAFGMTQDAALKAPTQKALDFIINGQHKTRGGWRYSPSYGSDTSVTGWMMMALKSGELAGLAVPSDTFRNVERWLDMAQKSPAERHQYVYNPLAPDTPQQRHGRRPNPTMTSVGLLMRLYTGWRRDNPHIVAGAEYLLSNPPEIGTRREPQRDTYYWYYATQVLFHMGGDYWKAWNEQLHPMLLASQEKTGPMAGSWNPRTPVPDRWGPHCGRLYVTTLNLLSLEVYYRHLPLYVETGK